jgi:hypothetical protein
VFYKYEDRYYEILNRVTREDNWTTFDVLRRLTSCINKFSRLRDIVRSKIDDIEKKYQNNMDTDTQRDIEQLEKFDESIARDMLECGREQTECREELKRIKNREVVPEKLIKEYYLKILNKEDIKTIRALDRNIRAVSDGLYGHLDDFFYVDDYFNNRSFSNYVNTELEYARQDFEEMTGISFDNWKYEENDTNIYIDYVNCIESELTSLKQIIDDLNVDTLYKIHDIYFDYIDRSYYTNHVRIGEFIDILLDEIIVNNLDGVK